MLDRYVAQVRLLVNVLPDVAAEPGFALKGGTAINLFHRDMPRLSVDIDLTWLPIGDRSTSLKAIDGALDRIGRFNQPSQSRSHGKAHGRCWGQRYPDCSHARQSASQDRDVPGSTGHGAAAARDGGI